MTAIVAGTIIMMLTGAIFRWVKAVPLVQTLSASIDEWADTVHGQEAEPLS